MKHLKLFNETASYDTYKNSEDYVLPNVSYIEETKGVKYERKKAFTLRATYNATPDNLVAFTGASNIKSLNVNGTPIEIEPIKNEIYTFDVLGENISINLDTSEATFPESYLIKSPVSSWSFKAKDPNYVINENTYVCMLGMMDGMTLAQPMPPEEMNYMFTTNDGVTIELIDTFLDEMNTQIAMGLQIGFTLMDVDVDSQTFTFIDTEHQTNVTTGGMSTYSFDSEGLYDVKIELADPDVKDIRFAGTPLTSIEISDDITSIGENVFYDDQTWQYCDNLTSVTIGSGVTSIRGYAFRGCRKLTNVYISDIAAWCNISFSDSESNPLNFTNNLYLNNKLVTDLIIPDSVTTIGEYAFYNCSSLTSVTIPDSVTTIGNWAFSDCSGLTSIEIPYSVTEIGQYAFQSCSGLTSITCYAPTAPIIYDNTFNSINKFGTLYYPEGSDYSNWLSKLRLYYWNMMITAHCTVTDVISTNDYLLLYTTSGISHLFVNGKEVTNFGSSYSNRVLGSYTIEIMLKDNVVDIQRMFKNVKSLNSVIIDNSVTSIGYEAFSGCINLTSVTIPDSVTEIGERAFNNCSSLTSVTIGDSVTTIGEYAFYNCSSLTSVTIPDNVTTIGESAFNSCINLTSVTIPDSVNIIKGSTFKYCRNLTSVTIPDSVTTIGYGAFDTCSSLKRINIPDSVTTIEQTAFEYCNSLTSITIPDNVTTIGQGAFFSCSGLTSIVVSSGNTKYDSRENCNCIIETATNTIIRGCNNSVIPDNVTTIGQGAFSGCDGLTSVTIPNNITSIGYAAFYDCDGLTSVTIPDSVTSIGSSAFEGCNSLALITCYATTSPSINANTFYKVSNDGILYVPTGSDYSSWMSTDYLGKYNWTIEYI